MSTGYRARSRRQVVPDLPSRAHGYRVGHCKRRSDGGYFHDVNLGRTGCPYRAEGG